MRVRVLGAGVVGLAVADELVARGHRVQVVDPAPASGASHAAAGMLCPAAEVWWGEEEILRLGVASLELWPEFAARCGVALREGATVMVGYDAGDLQQVQRQADLLGALGRPVTALDRRAVRELEPSLARVAGGARAEGEGSVDPRAVTAALRARLGDRVVAEPRPAGAEEPDVTVVATGARLPAPFADLVRGVRGEIVRLRSDDPPARVVRGWAGGEPIYLVPRGDGRVVVGATSEEHADDAVVSAGGVWRLLGAARALWPALDRAELLETTARDRPATADGLPLVGPTDLDGVLLAAGHHRHGVLLAPLTARLVADHLDDGRVEPALDPRRFPLPAPALTALPGGPR